MFGENDDDNNNNPLCPSPKLSAASPGWPRVAGHTEVTWDVQIVEKKILFFKKEVQCVDTVYRVEDLDTEGPPWPILIAMLQDRLRRGR